MKVRTGLDELIEAGCAPLHDQRVGLLVHPASVDRRRRHAVDLLLAADEVDLRALYGPQHGLLGQTQDNMIEWEGFTDPRTGLPVFSLYGEHRRPTPEMLDGIDTLVIDLQDVGVRYYTFIWTMLLCLRACAAQGKKVVVLDRPNPLGGVVREGPVLQAGYESFVGLAAIPMRHGLTIGELAGLFIAREALDLDLRIIWSQGWRREMDHDACGLPWVLPSPNMPTVETAYVYPGGCLLEGTELSEGRGTTRPFEICGAPYIDPYRLVTELACEDLPGCALRPLYFEPTFHKYAGRVCGGVQVHIDDRRTFAPVACYTALIAAVRRLWPDDFAWRQPPYEYETEKLPIDILAGGCGWREDIERGVTLADMRGAWQADVEAFDRQTADFRHHD